MYISCIFHVCFMLFVHLFPRWQRESQPTQRQIPVEYRLKAYFTPNDFVTDLKDYEIQFQFANSLFDKSDIGKGN